MQIVGFPMRQLICFFIDRYNHQSVVSAALRVVGNIVTGDDYQTQVSPLYIVMEECR